MNEHLTRQQFIRRAAAGGTMLTVPGLLSACGSGIKSGAQTTATTQTVKKQLAKTLAFSNWPLYIDVGKNKNHPSLDRSPSNSASRSTTPRTSTTTSRSSARSRVRCPGASRSAATSS